jgi:uncharacterized protein YcbK (DUF882 family)
MSSPRVAGPLGRVLTACSLLVVAAGLAGGAGAGSSAAAVAIGGGVTEAFAAPAPALRGVTRPADETRRAFALLDSLRGRSGKLRVRLVTPASQRAALVARLFGDSVVARAGVHDVMDGSGTRQFALITLRGFADKLDGRIGAYRIGYWPSERDGTLAGRYGNPDGFIEVTPATMGTPVSQHFQLRDFLTHDQQQVWPKYLVLDEDLVDKLELVIAELELVGHPVRRMRVMSGFRTPQYNAQGGEGGGRSSLSRHMYGDAADVFVDNDGNGRMDDLTRDGRIDHRDARVILEAVDRVERLHPDIAGGVGVYRATRAHGPFAHVDVRGHRARWGRL